MQITEKINQTSQSSINPFGFAQIYIPTIEQIVSTLESKASILEEYCRVDILESAHIEHLYNEGFTFSDIALWVSQGLRSLTKEQAGSMGFKARGKDSKWTSGGGLYFPYVENFGQLRLDEPIERKNGKAAKYLTPLGAKTQARIPANCKVVTEGAKDAAAGSLHGKIRTGAIAGISHYRKALEPGAGYTVLFDADGWTNPNVFSNLFHAGKWLNGKVQLIPEIEGYPKAGLCEYFKAGNTAEDYKQLVASAKKPEALLLEWGKHFGDIPENKLSQAVRTVLRLAAGYLDEIDQDVLISNIKSASQKVSGKTLNRELKKQRAIFESQCRKEEAKYHKESAADRPEPEVDLHPEASYREICKAKKLDFNNCVTSQTFDGWIYRNEFGATEGDWRVIDSAFYQWSESLGFWQHQTDNRLNSLICDAGEKAFKLKSSKEQGWQVVKPYETNSYKESAFKYCRSRLERPEPLPVNTHLRAFKNCVVDLRTGTRMPHDKNHYLTGLIPYDYEPHQDCPEVFRQFVADSFGEDMLSIVRAFTSMFLDPTAPYGRFPHLIGKSGGGKGTLGRFWNSMFGDDGCSSGDLSNLSTAEGRHQYLTGKSIFSVPDVGGYVSGLRAFYELVDNGGMSGRALFNPVGYSKAWNVRFWIASVDHLQVENAGDGWARRAYPIPVRVRNIQTDPDLRLKLEACKADVISWALAMPREERDRILLTPPTNERIINLTLDSALYGDSTKSFVDLCLRPSTEASFVPNHQLHNWYAAYCKEHGYTPLGMSKFISHLKTVLPQNFADRGWSPMVDGQRCRVPAHWQHVTAIPMAFVQMTDNYRDSGENLQSPTDPVWACLKSRCEEGGLMEFEDFWNPPKPPDNSGDNNTPPSNPPDYPCSTNVALKMVENGSTVQGGSIFIESLKQRNSGGVQGGSTVQGIGLDLEKNKISVLDKPFLEKSTEQTLTPEIEGVQLQHRVNSCNLTQNEIDYSTFPHLTFDTIEAKRNQDKEIKQRLLDASTKEELTMIKEEYSSRCRWVWKNVLTNAERERLTEVAMTKQLNLLDTSSQPLQIDASSTPASSTNQNWLVGDAVIVKADIPSLLPSNGRCGWVESVDAISLVCLVGFGEEESQYIPSRYLITLEELDEVVEEF